MNKLERFLLHNMYVYNCFIKFNSVISHLKGCSMFVHWFSLYYEYKRFVKSFSCQAIDKSTRIDLKTCSSTSSRAEYSVVCAFQRVRLKVNGEATHSQDFLSVGRFSFAAVCVRTPRMRNRTSLCMHARTRNRGIVRLRTCALCTRANTRFSSNKFHACLFRLRRGTSIFDPRCACFFFFVIFVSKERRYLLVVLFLN